MLKNILVPAGGFGSRLNGYKNPLKNKSLIEDEHGITLLEYTLRNIKEAAVASRIILVTREDIRSFIEDIAKSIGINYIICMDHDGYIGVRALPVLCKNELGDKPFGLICGHAPFTPEHLQRMVLKLKDKKDEVVSLYTLRNKLGNDNKMIKVKIDGFNKIEMMCDDETKFSNYRFFMESPFILSPEIIELIEEDNCTHWLGYYLLQQFRKGTRVHGMEATFPSEGDAPYDIEETFKWINSQKQQVMVQ